MLVGGRMILSSPDGQSKSLACDNNFETSTHLIEWDYALDEYDSTTGYADWNYWMFTNAKVKTVFVVLYEFDKV